ncbi:DUF460 domain-containing protein, partial [Halobium palmae]
AALFAVDAHESQFERVARKVPAGFDRDEVVARVVGGDESVEAVLRELTDDGEEENEESTEPQRELTAEEKRIRDLESQVDRLESHVEDLRERLESKDETIEEYEEELSAARREERREARERREVKRLERDNDRLERERDDATERADELESKLDRLKTLWKLDHSNFADVSEGRDIVSVKVVEQFTTGAIDYTDEHYGLAAGDVVYLRDASGAGRSTAEKLAATDPRIVLKEGGLSDVADDVLFDAGIPVGPADDVQIQEVDELA